ncbi:uncharacterized protein LOC115996721 isoform X2 [Ipomoea triloba]|nr:uncharacterized protein LOC115996721 isoform X2 [Ipomoea triloba]
MGTPTVCSSLGSTAFLEFPDSFRLGDEHNKVRNSGNYRKLSDFGDPSPSLQENEDCDQMSEAEKGLAGIRGGVDLYGNAESFLMHDDIFMENLDVAEGWGVKTDELPVMGSDDDEEERSYGHGSEEDTNRGVVGVDVQNSRASSSLFEANIIGHEEVSVFHRGFENFDGKLEASGLHSGFTYDAAESGGCLDGCDTSSRNDHSEDDHSMFGGETDTEEKIDSYSMSNLPQFSKKHDENENKFLMGSAVAFGSDDWDDFVFQTEANSLDSVVQDDFQVEKKQNFEVENGVLAAASLSPAKFSSVSSTMQPEEAKSALVYNKQGRNGVSAKSTTSSTVDPFTLLTNCKGEEGEHPKSPHTEISQSHGVDESAECHNSVLQEVPFKDCLENREGKLDQNHQCTSTEEGTQTHASSMDSESTTLHLEPFSSSASGEHSEDTKAVDLELNEFYDEVVHDMEEILLDSGESSGFALGNRIYQSYIPLVSRDGGSTASTSGTDDAYPVIQHPWRISGVEVIGARQKNGNVSLSERILGVKEYTVYKIRVWSGEESWDVERRFRDFCTLHRRLKKSFAEQGRVLPSPWSSIERESIKVFGSASPDVITGRSVLIQDCLQSVLHSRFSSGPLNALICFLSPSQDIPNSPDSDTNVPRSPPYLRDTSKGDISTFGKTISLIVQNRPFKSVKQLLDEQHYACAGCYMNFGDGKSRIQELVQTLGWGKPRLCEYSGQLYCSSCHTNDTAVLPARVLHCWDFNHYSVSQLAKSYLESIRDQPMLCVSAVNPVLFSKVPALQHVTNIRKRIGAMLPFVRCSFRGSIYKGVGSRRYLLESSDFFALRDLIDLSKGVFAALPVMVETISRKITEHITEQCLICCDVGVPCNARQHCDDLSSLIFPFQEGEVERCKSCKSVFHKKCFKKISTCPCGTQLNPEPESNATIRNQSITNDGSSTLELSGKRPDSSKGFLSALFPKVKSPRSSGSREQGHKHSDTVILMGSLPSNTL